MSAKGTSRHWAVLVGCCLLIGFCFTIPMLCFGVFIAPMVAYFGCSMTEISIYFVFTAASGIVSCLFGARILRRSMRVSVVVSSLVIGAAYVAAAAFPSVPMVWLAGIAVGLSYPLCTTVFVPIAINTWFAVRQGTFVGLSLAMVGVFGMAFSPLFTMIIGAAGWQVALTIAGVAVAVMGCLIAVFLLRESPEAEGLLPYGAESAVQADTVGTSSASAGTAASTTDPGASNAVAGASNANAVASVSNADASASSAGAGAGNASASNADASAGASLFANPAFWLCAVVAMFGGFLGDFNSQLNAVAQTAGFDAVTAGFALSCASAGLMIGKLLMGWLKDLKGSTIAILVGCGFGVVAFTTFVTGTTSGAVPLLYAGAFLSGFCTCLGTLSAAFLSAAAFETSAYARGVSYLTAFCNLGMAVGIPFYSLTYDLLGSYQPILVGCIIVPVVVAIVATAGIRLGAARRHQLSYAHER